MDQRNRVKILNTHYDRETNLVLWDILFLDGAFQGQQRKLAWLGSDLGQSLGVTSDIRPDLMEDFCEKMKNKEINLVSQSSNSIDISKFNKNTPTTDIDKANNDISKYPFEEIAQYLESQNR